MLLVVLTSLLVLLLSILLWRRWQQLSVLRRLGIDGPAPSLIFGNFWRIRNIGHHDFVQENTELYGKCWGYYEGTLPIVVTYDADVAKQVLIKDFSKFFSRKPEVLRPSTRFVHLFGVTNLPQWKRLRCILSPSFTGRRMKEMSPLINQCVDPLINLFHKRCENNEEFDVHGDMQKLTLDTIASCAFGIETNSIEDPDSEFLRRVRSQIGMRRKTASFSFRYILPIFMAFPFLFHLLKPLIKFSMRSSISNNNWMLQQAYDIIQLRRQHKSERADFVNIMVKANAAENSKNSDVLETPTKDDVKQQVDNVEEVEKAPEKLYKSLTLEEMMGNCVLFILAGFETSSITLGFVAYELALNPGIQAKLQEEIDAHFEDEDCRPDYVSVQKMHYLDMFFSEVLRMHSVATLATTRDCNEDCRVGGRVIPAGMCLHLNMQAFHTDPDHWGPEPIDQCVPERFLAERVKARHPAAYMPFGNGPRNCIGRRFALMESKIAVVRILKNFSLQRCAATPVPLQQTVTGLRGPDESVTVRLTRR